MGLPFQKFLFSRKISSGMNRRVELIYKPTGISGIFLQMMNNRSLSSHYPKAIWGRETKDPANEVAPRVNGRNGLSSECSARFSHHPNGVGWYNVLTCNRKRNFCTTLVVLRRVWNLGLYLGKFCNCITRSAYSNY